jgi:hypothetical protein
MYKEYEWRELWGQHIIYFQVTQVQDCVGYEKKIYIVKMQE